MKALEAGNGILTNKKIHELALKEQEAEEILKLLDSYYATVNGINEQGLGRGVIAGIESCLRRFSSLVQDGLSRPLDSYVDGYTHLKVGLVKNLLSSAEEASRKKEVAETY